MSQQRTDKKPDAIHSLINDLAHKERREEAHRALAHIGEPAILPLAEALTDINLKDRWVRWEMVKILAAMLHPNTAPVLVKELENEDYDIRLSASEGLIALGYKSLSPLLNALIKCPESSGLQWGSHHVLDDLYAGQVHESESGYTTLYALNDELKPALRRVIIALDNMDRAILVPLAARHALDVLKTHHSELV